MSQNITMVRSAIVLGVVKTATTAVTGVPDQEAYDLVWRGDAVWTSGTPPTQTVEIDSTLNINSTQIADSSTVGKAVLTAASAGAAQTALGAGAQGAAVFGAATFDALLTAMGASLGAADSGGTGFKSIRVPNATT